MAIPPVAPLPTQNASALPETRNSQIPFRLPESSITSASPSKNSSRSFLDCIFFFFKSLWNRILAFFQSKKPVPIHRKVLDANFDLFRQGFYINSRQEKIPLKDGEFLSQASQYHVYTPIEPVQPRFEKTQIVVIQEDSLTAAAKEVDFHRVLVLNFASPEYPGGGLEGRRGGQEEDLCFRSELAGFMREQLTTFEANLGKEDPEHQQLYPLYSMTKGEKIPGCVHTPVVLVFRASESQSYALLDEPYQVGILSSAAPHEIKNIKETLTREKKLTPDSPEYCSAEKEIIHDVHKRTRMAILNQLTVAYRERYECLILGAFGCGAFEMSPVNVASFYDEIIQTYFKGAFKKIVFAILPDGRPKNLEAFKAKFNSA